MHKESLIHLSPEGKIEDKRSTVRNKEKKSKRHLTSIEASSKCLNYAGIGYDEEARVRNKSHKQGVGGMQEKDRDRVLRDHKSKNIETANVEGTRRLRQEKHLQQI